MAESKRGRVGWVDLTVDKAESLRDFYAAVMGWEAEGLEMGGYDDYVMTPIGSEEPAAGVCHRKGQNADLPAQWIVYFVVDDVQTAVHAALKRGGKLLRPPEEGSFALVQDPAGAIFALHEGEPEVDEAD
jgi:predicted enzyme related to lactoylglutathione lyase